MTSHTTLDFRRDLMALPRDVRRQAKLAFQQFMADSSHPGLHFKKLPPHADIWSVRISASYRAMGKRRGEEIVWFFVGSHADYDKVLDRL